MDAPSVRKIIHVDMDAFYASVEVRDNPSLKGKPVVVGGSPDSRGVVAAASYEAREFGIHSAMPASRARRLCPQAVFLQPDFTRYRAASAGIRAVFERYTALIEPLALDEAFLDVTENFLGEPSATRIAERIKQEIFTEVGLTASAGVSINKFLAKIASDEDKPDGLFVITPEQVDGFLEHLSLGKVPGIGKITQRQLADLGLETCGQLRKQPLAWLEKVFGRRGEEFYWLARGVDNRPVVAHRKRKSISIEDTFQEDHGEPEWLMERLAELAKGLEKRAASAGVKGRTLTLKLRLADFRIHTRSRTEKDYMVDAAVMLQIGQQLFEASGLLGQKLRLMGLGLSHLDIDEEPLDTKGQLEFPFITREKSEAPQGVQ